jgi:hypothetical protein
MLHRLRSIAAVAMVAVLSFFVLPRVQAQPVAFQPVASHAIAVHQSIPLSPASPRTLPLNLVALGAIAGATAVKRSRSNPNMIVDSIIHVARQDNRGNPITLAVQPGVLADDTELTDDEIDESIARGSIRYATPAELHRLEQIAAQRETTMIARDADRTTSLLNGRVEAERQRIIADLDAEKQRQLAELDTKVEQARTELAKDTAERAASASASMSTSSSTKRVAAPLQKVSGSTASTAGAAKAASTPPASASTSPDVGAEASQPNPAPASSPTPPSTAK